MSFLLLLALIYIGIPALVIWWWSSKQPKKSSLKSNKNTNAVASINYESLSTEQKLAQYFDQLSSPRDKSVIIDFATKANIDLNNPKGIDQQTLTLKQKSTADSIIKANGGLVYQEQNWDASSNTDYQNETVKVANNNIQQNPTKVVKNIDSANYLLFAGAALIVVALLFFANAASETFGTGVRFVALLLTSVILYTIGLWVYSYKDALKPVGSAFIWIAILSVPAIGFSLYKDIFDSSQGSLTWFITSLIGVAYVLLAYKLLKTSQYLEYLTYAAALNMLLATVSVVNTNIKLYAITGIVYAASLIILHSKGKIGGQGTLPLKISITVAVTASILFGVSVVTNFSYSEAMWLGVYGLILSAYIIALTKIYKNSLSSNSINTWRAFCGLIIPWSTSLIISSLLTDYTSLFSVLPLALTSIAIALLLILKNQSIAFYKNWIIVATILTLSTTIASPSAYDTALIYGAYSLVVLVLAIKKLGMFAPIVALFGIPTALLIANSAFGTLDFIAALSLSTALAYLLGVILVFFKTINQKIIAIISCILWSISSFTLISQGYFAETGIMFAAGAVTMLVWQRQFYPLPLMNVALPLSILSPLVGYIDSGAQTESYLIGIFIFILWAVAVKFYRILFRSPWFITYIITSTIFNILAFVNLSSDAATVVLTISTVISAIFIYLGHNLYQWMRVFLSINLTYTFLLTMVAFGYSLNTNVNLFIILIAVTLYTLAALWPLVIKNKVLKEHKLSTYIRIADVAVLLIISFMPLLLGDDLANKILYASLAIIACSTLMTEGFILNRGLLRYGGSLAILLAILQLIWVLGVNNTHVYTHAIGLYLLGLGYVVYTYRNRKDIADNLILGSVLIVLIVLSLDALGGSTSASLAVLIESSTIALIAGVFKHKPALIASIAVLIVSVVYRASSFLASIPTWVWYLLVGAGLIAAATYMLSKNSKK